MRNLKFKQPFKSCDFEIKNNYINIPCSFDIEVSSFLYNNEKQSIMYLYGLFIDNICYIGRNWKDFIKDIKNLILLYNVSLERKLVIYVHNLSYEFQFFRKFFEWENVFILDNRKICRALTKLGIEFRCSYILSNYSLKNLANNIPNYTGKKLDEFFNYDKIRTPRTRLNKIDIDYIYYDCEIVYEYIKFLLQNYDIDNIPLTSTSFVRQNLKIFKRKYPHNNYNLKIKNKENYILLRQSFIGAFTHANYHHVNKIIEDVYSFDETSAYPWAIVSQKYPCETPKDYEVKDKNDFLHMINNYYCIFEIEFDNIISTFDYDNYISKSKCTYIERYTLNNGRVIYAKKLRIVINEIDFNIISKTYKWDKVSIGKFLYGRKDFLPKYIIIAVLKYFNDKTKLKDNNDEIVNYMRSKNNLNSIYGAMVTDIIRDEIVYNNEKNCYLRKNVNIEEVIQNYDKQNNLLWYIWGLYVPTYNRYNVWKMILKLKDDYIYTDTDSLKIKNNHFKEFEEYNKEIDRKIELLSSIYDIPIKYFKPKTKYGKVKTLGYFDYEGKYDYFKTLGAKRYMSISNNELEITISGVKKKEGKDYLIYKYGKPIKVLENFNDGIIFPSEYEIIENGETKIKNGTGKLTLTYLDNEMKGIVKDYTGKYYKYHELSGIHAEKTSYSLSLESTFLMLLKGEINI